MTAAVVGTGVLVLPAAAVRTAGPAALVAVGALVVLSVGLATTFAALGSRHPHAGGISHVVALALGPKAATVTAWWFYLGVPLGVPAMGLFAGDYLQTAIGGGATTRTLTALVVVLVAAAVNSRGLRASGGAQVVLGSVLVVGLLVLVLAGLPAAETSRLSPFAVHGWGTVAPAALLLFWMLTGWEAVSHLTGRFAVPARDVPRATAATLAIVALLFGGVTHSLLTAAGPDPAQSSAPITELLAAHVGPPAAALAASLAILVTLGNTNAYVAGLGELGRNMGRSAQAPRWLAGRNGSAVPRRSIAVVTAQSVVSLLVVSWGGWSAEVLVVLTAAAQVAVYGIGLVAALRLLPRRSTGWWAAVTSLPPVLVLGVLSGWHLLLPAVLAGAALLFYRARAFSGRHA